MLDEAEKQDAWRVQIAAVAAQQAELDEREARLAAREAAAAPLVSAPVRSLEAQQRAWRLRRQREQAVLRVRQRDLDRMARALQQAHAALAEEKAQWERRQIELREELHGLNQRILHLREQLPAEPAALSKQRAALAEQWGTLARLAAALESEALKLVQDSDPPTLLRFEKAA